MDRSFLKHAATYGLATLLTQAGGFVLLPLYLRCLGPADYGVLEVVGRLAETFGALLLFGGLRQAMWTFYQQATDDSGRARVVGATFLLVGVSSVAGGAVALFFAPQLGAWLAPGGQEFDPWLIRLAVAGMLLEPLIAVPLTLLQARQESWRYVVVVGGQLLVRVTACVVLVRFCDFGVAGVLTATGLTSLVFSMILVAREIGHGVKWPDLARLRAMTVFALPLLPGGLCFLLLNHGDRFILLRSFDKETVGLYALGYKLAGLVAVFSLSPLYVVWSSRMYAAAKRDDAPVLFGQVFVRIAAAYAFVGLGLCLFADEAVFALGGRDYASSAAIIPPVVLACLFQSASSLMDSGLYVSRKTGRKLFVTLATTAVMLTLYVVLIPLSGAMGAALATLGGFAFLAVATHFVSQHAFRVRYPWLRLAGVLALAIAPWLLSLSVPASPWGIAAKAGLWVGVLPIAWIAKLVSADEKRFLVELFARLRRPSLLTADR